MADLPLNPIADGLASLAAARSPEDLLRLLSVVRNGMRKMQAEQEGAAEPAEPTTA